MVGVNGNVRSIQRGTYEDYAVLDGAKVEISGIVTDKPSSDPDFKKNYLSGRRGKEVEVEVTDRISGKKVPVKALLKDYSIDDRGRISATLDNLYIPVDSIENVAGGTGNNLANYTNLIGFRASGRVHDARYENLVNVDGVVKSVHSGVSENYAVMDGVEVQVAEIVTDNPSADPNFRRDYLILNQEKKVTVVIKDPVSGNKVTVEGIVVKDSVNVETGTNKVTVRLDGVNVPVDSINDIRPVQ
jgi:flagellar basal-body rod modification protein FlgD